MLAALSSACLGYGDAGSHPAEDRVAAASSRCAEKLGTATGAPWYECVVDELLEEQTAAKESNSQHFFPIVPHDPMPLKPRKQYMQADLLKNLLRNFTCDHDDGGSQPHRSITWEYEPPDPCPTTLPPPFAYNRGFLPAGADLPELGASGPMTEARAMKACEAEPQCAGFTYSSPKAMRYKGSKHVMHFKSASKQITDSDDWHTWVRSRSAQLCNDAELVAEMRKPQRLRVDVLREEPPVYLVHDFASDAECDYMLNLTIPDMTPSVVSGGGTSRARQSWSVNMYPDWYDEFNVVTRMSRRKFAFARDVAGYEELAEGPGQEPINAVYYKDWDDQYRPHCDGECNGGPYRRGQRIASSLTYCSVADVGGYTAFTKSGLKVQPKVRQMLFFGYKLKEGDKMDNGLTEHTGCPLREGRKWIATMWYREGMTAENGWEKNRM